MSHGPERKRLEAKLDEMLDRWHRADPDHFVVEEREPRREHYAGDGVLEYIDNGRPGPGHAFLPAAVHAPRPDESEDPGIREHDVIGAGVVVIDPIGQLIAAAEEWANHGETE